MMQKSRIVYFDYLRIIASLAVVFIHVVAYFWTTTEVHTSNFNSLNLYDSITRWAVPIFVMISGTLFLGNERSIRSLYFKNIFRLVFVFFAWSIIYVIIEHDEVSAEYIASSIITGHFHMWFIIMICGLYVLVPFLNVIVKEDKLVIYAFVLLFIFSCLLPWMTLTVNYTGFTFLIRVFNAISEDIGYIFITMITGYIGYFLAGYYINKKDIPRIVRFIIYGLGVIGFVMTYLLTKRVSYSKGFPVNEYYGDSTLNIMFTSIAVFVFAKYNLSRLKEYKVIKFLSDCSLGAYLVHMLVFDLIIDKVLPISENYFKLVPFISVIVFVVSFIISAILNKLKGLLKLIV